MTVFEILNFNKELLMRLSDIGFKAGDCKYIELYSDYDRMRKSGEKVTYIVSVLSEKYNVSERIWGHQAFRKRLHDLCSVNGGGNYSFCRNIRNFAATKHCCMRKEYLTAPLPFVGQKMQGKRFVYFTSNKSSIVELCNWLGNNKNLGNPFEDANKVEFNAHMNYNSHYTDIMLYRIA